MTRLNRFIAMAFAAVVFCIGSSGASAATWLGAVDANGCTWARVRIDNLSTNATTWVISSCRTAVASTDQAAQTDAASDWDGVVAAGASSYVWVYGMLAGAVNISTAGGTDSGYNDYAAPDLAGNGEWVITVASDGAVTASIESASYGVPSQTGTLPNFTE